ncbi:DUF6807 family protein [Pseudonocardia sp. HH130630-07]|uniref:DUF6807 family protein n=1 Tax=Pseudonocardia sp. HH130630-07 TaxID=1690815 RepID=UPI000814E443|nr:DUF6807 family protein [Pseudonocardia sp. HH130630-07]ANY09259.1 hypothetical protein AFB00_26825 [Pseudonocardia sp. HH130630-07]
MRNDPFPAIAPSPAFHDPIVLGDGETIELRHRYVIADGVREPDELAGWAGEFGDTAGFAGPHRDGGTA